MAEGQNEKYLNIPVLTPEEEEEIERREAILAAARLKEKPPQQKTISDAASAVLGGGIRMEKTADAKAADAKTADTSAAESRPADTISKPAGENTSAQDADEPLFTEVMSEDELREHLSKLDRETLDTVLSASELFKSCVLPDKTELQERLLKTKSDIIIGDHSRIEFGLTGEDVAVCECTTINGDIMAGGDLRLDNFCEVFGTVICNGDAYIGEGVKIHGKMTVGGNLDVAESVTIDKEFKTFGNITIRNPTPVILYLLIYIFALLQINGEKAAEKKLNAMLSEAQTIPLVLPPKTTMDLAYFSVITPMEIGANCRLHGNIKAVSVKMKHDTTLFGSIHASNKIKIGVRDAVHGDVAASAVRIERGADVLGDVLGDTVWMHEDARVSGVIKATAGLTLGAGN